MADSPLQAGLWIRSENPPLRPEESSPRPASRFLLPLVVFLVLSPVLIAAASWKLLGAPRAVLAGGLLVAGLAGLAAHFARVAELRRRALAASAAALEARGAELLRAEEALQESESSVRALYNVASAQEMTFADRVQAILDLGRQRFGLEIGILARVRGGFYEVVQARSPDNAIPSGGVFELGDTWCCETMAARRPVAFEHAAATARRDHPAYNAFALEAYCGAPVRVAGRPFGTLSFSSSQPRSAPFKPADLEFLKLVALWVGGELERDQRNREIVLLSELGGLLQTCDSIAEAHEVICRQGRKLFPDLEGVVFRLNESRSDLEPVAAWGPDGEPEDDLFRPEDCWALRLGREHFVEDPASDLLCPHLACANPADAPSSYLCVPMVALGEALGVLHLRVPPGRSQGSAGAAGAAGTAGETTALAESRRRLAEAVAEHTATALANLNLRESLRHQSIRDPLTGLFNRRHFEEALQREVRRARRRRAPLGVVMIDIDRFKQFNDTFGHEAGDELLRAFGELLRGRVRSGDVPCRYGGEELALLLPDASLDTTRDRAEVLREATEALQVMYRGRPLGPITVSLGVAAFPDQGADGISVLRAADTALYQSKTAGRNRVTVASPAAG